VFALVAEHFPNTELFIVGDGPEKASLKKLIDELLLADKVKIIDSVCSTVNALSVMDLFVSCTEYESFGLAIVEAMASHLAVVASNVGGIPCVLEDGVSGILAEFDDLSDFAEKIERFIKDDKLRLAYAERARKIAFAKFGLERMAEQTKQVYLEALK
jgi:glycosyltransferase involved in cell wall biosynthesis